MNSPRVRGPPAAIPLRGAVPRHRRRPGEKGSRVLRAAFQRRVIELVDFLPPLSFIVASGRSIRGRATPARAPVAAHVLAETPRTSAVSSTLRPPKKRSSTTRLLRASSAQRSAPRRAPPGRRSGSVGTWTRLRQRDVLLRRRRASRSARARAKSTRMRRINLRGDAEEVRAVLPLHGLPVDQPQVGFVDQCRRLQTCPGRSRAM